jgi:hypothetical protein
MIARFFALVLLVGVSTRGAALQIVPGAFSSGKAYFACTFDGAKERCLLDTGSAMTLVTDTKFFASYTNLGAFRFKSAAGIAQQTETIQIGSIQIDDVTFSNVKIGRAKFRGAEKTLGIDFLGRQPFAVSFQPQNVLVLNASRPKLPQTTLAVSPQGLLSIPIGVSGVQIHALWDTGVALTTVDKGFMEEHPENFRPTKNYVNGVDGAGKSMLLQVFRARKITIADRNFENVHVVAVDLSLLREANKDIQAVVGFNLIRKANWFFDAKNRLWKCER